MDQAQARALFFMHIGKTGGSYVSRALRDLNKRAGLGITFGAHRLQLRPIVEATPDAGVIFGIRDPLEIFVSGFYSRLRKGWPKYESEWSPAEAKAFARFDTPNQLAEALTADDRKTRAAARDAMASIQHVKRGLRHYLGDPAFLSSHRDNVFFILDQEHLDDDLALLFAGFGHKIPKRLREATGVRHTNPEGLDRSLSPLARANLEAHYAVDRELFQLCRTLRAGIIADRTERVAL